MQRDSAPENMLKTPPRVARRIRSEPSTPLDDTPHKFENDRSLYRCTVCRKQMASLRCVSCSLLHDSRVHEEEGRLLCNFCSRRPPCSPTHVKTRVYYTSGPSLGDRAAADETRCKEYKSVAKFCSHQPTMTPADLVKKKCATYINGFLNSFGGGVICFGVAETREEREGGDEDPKIACELNLVVEEIIWNRVEREAARRHVGIAVRRMYPPVPIRLYNVIFVPVHRPNGARAPNCYVCEIHVAHSDRNIHSIEPPLCFVDLCVAYERREESTVRLSTTEIEHRLGVSAVPKSIKFRDLVQQLTGNRYFVERVHIDILVAKYLKRVNTSPASRFEDLGTPTGILLVGDYGSGKSSWVASRVMHAMAQYWNMPARKKGSKCFVCGKQFSTRRELLNDHLKGKGLCPEQSYGKHGTEALNSMNYKLLGYHFCNTNDVRTINPARFVRSLAAQIVCGNVLRSARGVLFGRDVERALAEHRCNADPDSSFENGILRPLRSLKHVANSGSPYVILVDGLDECDRGEGFSKLEQGASRSIPELLSRAIAQFPPWLTLVATSRPNQTVERLCSSRHFTRISLSDLSTQSIAGEMSDLGLFVQRRLNSMRNHLFSHMSSGDSEEKIFEKVRQAIFQRADGNFLFASMVLDDMEQGGTVVSEIMSRDAAETSVSPMKSLTNLSAMYLRNFLRSFGDRHEYSSVESPVRSLFEVLIAAQEPPSIKMLRNIIGNVDFALAKARQYLREELGGLKLVHRSLMDWLLTTTSVFACRADRGQLLLAAAILRKTNAVLGGPTAEFGSRLAAFVGDDIKYMPTTVAGTKDSVELTPQLVYRCVWQLFLADKVFRVPRSAETGLNGDSRRLLSLAFCTHRTVSAIDVADAKGRTAVFLACQASGSADVLEILLGIGAKHTGIVKPSCVTPLHIAARRDDLRLVSALVSRCQKSDIDARCRKGKTPLLNAAAKGSAETVRLLLISGCNFSVRDIRGRDALMYAASAGHLSVLREIHRYESASSFRLFCWMGSMADKFARLPMWPRLLFFFLICIILGTPVLLWVDNFLSPIIFSIVTITGTTLFIQQSMLHFRKKQARQADLVLADGRNALYLASANGHAHCISILIAMGADVNAFCGKKGSSGTPLWVACDRGHNDVVLELLKARDIHINVGIHCTWDKLGKETVQTALLRAILMRLPLDVCEAMLQHGADPNICDRTSGRTALMMATENGDSHYIPLLCRYGADPNLAASRDLSTATLLAAFHGYADILQILLNIPGVDPMLEDMWRMTSLHYACARGHEKVVKILLSNSVVRKAKEHRSGEGGITAQELVETILRAETEPDVLKNSMEARNSRVSVEDIDFCKFKRICDMLKEVEVKSVTQVRTPKNGPLPPPAFTLPEMNTVRPPAPRFSALLNNVADMKRAVRAELEWYASQKFDPMDRPTPHIGRLSPRNSSLVYPPLLDLEMRKFMHSLAESLGLKSKSKGHGRDRFIVVKRGNIIAHRGHGEKNDGNELQQQYYGDSERKGSSMAQDFELSRLRQGVGSKLHSAQDAFVADFFDILKRFRIDPQISSQARAAAAEFLFKRHVKI